MPEDAAAASEERRRRQESASLDSVPPPDSFGGPYGRLSVKTVRKPDSCDRRAKRGDALTIAFEARISSATGPLYDGTAWRKGALSAVKLGKGAAVPGVEIGLAGMCVGEVREIDVPATLGYGKFGSQVFDIPGDVRLWWRVELLDLKWLRIL
ncbi:hypothetical protein ACHAWF_013950 [Thalassiosira exigua]